jgi:RNA polymerase sigma-70 factor, ECF subfamily
MPPKGWRQSSLSKEIAPIRAAIYVIEKEREAHLAEVPENGLEDALARSARGDTSAFGEVVRGHQAMVYSLALHFLRDAALAEDVAQEVFLELYRNLAKIKSAAHLRFWLRKVACHRSLDHARRNRPDGILRLEEVPEPAATAAKEDPLLEDLLWRLVGSLPEKPRLALILHYQEDLTVAEIAEVMEVPLNTVKSLLERALGILREKLARARGGVKV